MMPHYEKDLVINNRELEYSGIFKVEELISTINRALENKGYEKQEKKTEETVRESGRKTHIELRPFKIKSTYVQLMIKIKITAEKVVEVVEEGRKFEKGELMIVFDSWVLSDYKDRWGMKPWQFFWKGIINKYLYTFPLEAGFRGELAEDTAYIYGQINQLLKSYIPGKVLMVSEADVVASMADELAEIEKNNFKNKIGVKKR